VAPRWKAIGLHFPAARAVAAAAPACPAVPPAQGVEVSPASVECTVMAISSPPTTTGSAMTWARSMYQLRLGPLPGARFRRGSACSHRVVARRPSSSTTAACTLRPFHVPRIPPGEPAARRARKHGAV
jgi:hypothetical protein